MRERMKFPFNFIFSSSHPASRRFDAAALFHPLDSLTATDALAALTRDWSATATAKRRQLMRGIVSPTLSSPFLNFLPDGILLT